MLTKHDAMNNETPVESAMDNNRFRPIWLDFIPNVHKRYPLYYDEANNIRRLVLKDTGLSHDALNCFVLGGIALEPGAALRAQLRIQKSTPEMKLRRLVQGDCAACLDSRKVEPLC